MSGDGQITISFHRLLETSAHIQTAVSALHTQLDQIERDAAPLVATWGGEARQAYQERQDTWRRASADLTTMLQAIKRALDDTIADFQNTERANTNLFIAGRG